MTQLINFKSDLEKKDGIEWFDVLCDFLKREKFPSTKNLTLLIGDEKPNPNNEIRGSKFLIPFDKKFVWACISPNLSDSDVDKAIDYFKIGGKDFSLKMTDILVRFPNYKIKRNTYDGGTQIFFYPISDKFEFSAISFDIDKDPEDITNIKALIFHYVTFHFGNKLTEGRDGFGLQR